jgi:hypothetical protein
VRWTRHFGKDLSNTQHADLESESVPAFEMPKSRKLAFEFNGSMTHENLVFANVVKHLEAAIDKQTEVLSKICRILESCAK